MSPNDRALDEAPGAPQDHAAAAGAVFDRHAERYRDKFMDVAIYDRFYRELCARLPVDRPPRVLDAPCGPGNVARFVLNERPDADLLGIDLAPRMVEIARAEVPAARFEVGDCRAIGALPGTFDAIVNAFGLPYLTPDEADAFLATAAGRLAPDGLLLVSTMTALPARAGWETTANGEARLFMTYHAADELLARIAGHGFEVLTQALLDSPPGAAAPTRDLIVLARRA